MDFESLAQQFNLCRQDPTENCQRGYNHPTAWGHGLAVRNGNFVTALVLDITAEAIKPGDLVRGWSGGLVTSARILEHGSSVVVFCKMGRPRSRTYRKSDRVTVERPVGEEER